MEAAHLLPGDTSAHVSVARCTPDGGMCSRADGSTCRTTNRYKAPKHLKSRPTITACDFGTMMRTAHASRRPRSKHNTFLQAPPARSERGAQEHCSLSYTQVTVGYSRVWTLHFAQLKTHEQPCTKRHLWSSALSCGSSAPFRRRAALLHRKDACHVLPLACEGVSQVGFSCAALENGLERPMTAFKRLWSAELLTLEPSSPRRLLRQLAYSSRRP